MMYSTVVGWLGVIVLITLLICLVIIIRKIMTK